jgi:hypothetical protein
MKSAAQTKMAKVNRVRGHTKKEGKIFSGDSPSLTSEAIARFRPDVSA